MAERRSPKVFTIPVYRSFTDALAAGLLAQYGKDRLALARGMILVPNNRAIRVVTDAFVRRAEEGLLLPRIVAVGDVGEAPGTAIDDIAANVPRAVDPLMRRMILARLIQQERAIARQPVGLAEAVRLAGDLGGVLDEMIAEDIDPRQLRDLEIGSELSVHWQKSLDLFASVTEHWPDELARLGRIDLPERRNRLLRALARRWREAPPPHFVVAAGVTSAAQAVAELLNSVARLPQGAVVLPGLDLASPDAEWAAIWGEETQRGIETHPQHHLRLLLERIGVARDEVVRWRWGDGKARKAVRGRAVSNAFAPARFTARWIGLPPAQRRLKGVRLAEFTTPAEEAQGIAIAIREVLETPAKTVALVTPNRDLAGRVAAHLRRWSVEADDSAGQPLASTPIGILLQAIAALGLERFAPVALLAVLKHPLVRDGDARLDWLDGVRKLDVALRGPRPASDLAGLSEWLAGGQDKRERYLREPAQAWWAEQAPLFADFEAAFASSHPAAADLLGAVRDLVSALCGDAAWSGPAGRAVAELLAEVESRIGDGPSDFARADLLPLLRQLLGEVAIRPPQGGHPRVAILGLLEARLQQADLTILGGLNEGVWPQGMTADPWLSPGVRRALGLADPERRVGLAAHDLAIALGAGEVLITRAARDTRAATVPSRFLLRLDAMTGGLDRDARLPLLARGIDANGGAPQPVARPAPAPPASERPRHISVTAVDRLKADPYAFYARATLGLSPLDALDAEPGPAWRGSAIHKVFEGWSKEDRLDPETLMSRVDAMLNGAGVHPVVRALWRPRLIEAIRWVGETVEADRARGREPAGYEVKGVVRIAGIDLDGRADRIDRIDDGTLAIVDYKSGKAPSNKAVADGFAMQLGLLAAIAEAGGFEGFSGKVSAFEYWSLAKDKDVFGKRSSPVTGKTAICPPTEFAAKSIADFVKAAETWLTGDAPFTAKLNPDYAAFADYDQLMRKQEWYERGDR